MKVDRATKSWLKPASRILLLATVAAWGCTRDVGNSIHEPQTSLVCSIDTNRVRSGGVPRDGIPALSNPELVGKDDASLDYLDRDSRVLGIVLDGQPIAVPHAILWWHEIVNFDRGGQEVAVTFCPLTGSALAFDRSAIDGQLLGVSGLLFDNNLIMFNRTNGPASEDSLWPQMLAEARCGPDDGFQMPQVPIVEISWDGWRRIHPNTLVISGRLPFDRDYGRYPYGDYDALNQPEFFFSMPIQDNRRLQKEVVIGVPDYSGSGIAFPTLALKREGSFTVVEDTHRDLPLVLFWDTEKEAGMAYRPIVDGQVLPFTATAEGIFDEQTGSRWNVLGLAVDGPLAGTELEPIPETYVAFWGAWINFHRDSRLWQP
jgi:hypothetical protein